MARGFDSKSVEYQQEEAQRSREEHGRERPLSEEERGRIQRRRTLELARARTAADLARAASPAQRQMLGRAIAALDLELKSLAD
jgi:hypothetical protein